MNNNLIKTFKRYSATFPAVSSQLSLCLQTATQLYIFIKNLSKYKDKKIARQSNLTAIVLPRNYL